jgi:hypothetical protein
LYQARLVASTSSIRLGSLPLTPKVLEEKFPETQPELLAHHFMESGLNEQAVGYLQKAGERAVERSAH